MVKVYDCMKTHFFTSIFISLLAVLVIGAVVTLGLVLLSRQTMDREEEIMTSERQEKNTLQDFDKLSDHFLRIKKNSNQIVRCAV